MDLESHIDEVARRVDVRLRYHKRRANFFQVCQVSVNAVNIVGVTGSLVGFVSVFDVTLMLNILDELKLGGSKVIQAIRFISESAGVKMIYPFFLALIAVASAIINIVVDFGGLSAKHRSYQSDFRYLSMFLDFVRHKVASKQHTEQEFNEIFDLIKKQYSNIIMEAPLYMKVLLISCENEARMASAIAAADRDVELFNLGWFCRITKQILPHRDFVPELYVRTIRKRPEA